MGTEGVYSTSAGETGWPYEGRLEPGLCPDERPAALDPEETLVLVQSRQLKENKRPLGAVACGSIVVTIDPREDDQHHLNSRPRWGLPRRARRSTRVSANS